MPYAPADAHVSFTLHPDHHPGVLATTSGPTSDAARSHLHDRGFRSTGPDTMVLARIDREEPYYADRAANELARYGFTVDIAPELQEEIDTEWTWTDYPMPWCTPEEIRQVSADAQRIHDDIATRRLTIHLHANDGHTTVAVGTYATGVRRHVHLHGEDHLRQVSLTFQDEAEALAEFHSQYTVAVRPGPAPLTGLEQSVRQALCGKTAPMTHTPLATPPIVAGPGEHEEFLDHLLDSKPQWSKYRTWSDETTIASHESLTVRAEFDHEARHRTDIAWTIAEYDGPVGERLWRGTITAGTPVPFIRAITDHLDDPPSAGTTEPHVPLHEAGWASASHPARTTWRAPDCSLTFEHQPHAVGDRWTVFGGDNANRPAWSIRLSPGAPQDLLAQLTSIAAGATSPPPSTSRRSSPLPRLPVPLPQRHSRIR
ncbi:DUF317 domain-containing protein [Streptomyces antibioticus]|uniref:DUF317 domain-containing protein n=1 Tax=Streptomyces antibioticus TaxID=1890 RepID=A0AAE7CJ18_STRAT|nr:DUF317 domain-containing protein [Streptomyces antibioticus]OOQ55369.1 hypothetical protein AFM16_05080 [Streptomyces antibioticus]QIT43010.1 DUF317 domain-containing protein [Streptomyces antibioticus]